MNATIEERYKRSGFVYAGKTRMLFAPLFTATRNDADKDRPDLVISGSNWEDPTKGDLAAVIAALRVRFPGVPIRAETRNGLVPVYDGGESLI